MRRERVPGGMEGEPNKKAAPRAAFSSLIPRSALTGLEAGLRLVDHVDTALAAHDTTIAVTLLERAE